MFRSINKTHLKNNKKRKHNTFDRKFLSIEYRHSLETINKKLNNSNTITSNKTSNKLEKHLGSQYNTMDNIIKQTKLVYTK